MHKKNTFRDFKEYTKNVDVNYYSWIKNLFTRATENIFPKWQYYVPRDASKISILLRTDERDIRPIQIVRFIWGDENVTIVFMINGKTVQLSLDDDIDKLLKYDHIFEDYTISIHNTILSALNPLEIS